MSEENKAIEEEAAQANMQYTVSALDQGDVFLLTKDIAYVVAE